MPIASQTWRKLFEAVYEMNSAENSEDFAVAVVAGMMRLIRADVVVFQVLDRASGKIMTHMHPVDIFTPEEVAYYTAHSDDMPLVPYYVRTGDPKARRISDVIGESEWLDSEYYHRCLQRLDLPYCLVLPIAVDEDIIAALSFNRRKKDFSSDDCERLDAFGPHFRQAWKHQHGVNPLRDTKAEEMLVRRQFAVFGLRPRESEVLYWMTEGKQNREIATILGIQLGTVQEYVADILKKLDQENRHAATVFALQRLRSR